MNGTDESPIGGIEHTDSDTLNNEENQEDVNTNVESESEDDEKTDDLDDSENND